MPHEGDSLKAEMTQLLRADWERARERRVEPQVDLRQVAPPAPEPQPEPAEAPEAPPKRGLLRRLFS